MSEDIFVEIVVNTDGTVERTERPLTPEEIEEKYNPAPEPQPDPDEDISADAALDIIMGGADDDEG